MRSALLTLLGIAAVAVAPLAAAAPEDDRKALVDYFNKKYPDIKYENYVYGALAFDPDTKAQYDSIMDFPPFGTVLDTGKKMWDTPFKNGKTYASCFPDGGRNVAGNYPYFDNKRGKVVTLHTAINDCRVANGEEAFKENDVQGLHTLTSHMRTLSDGMKMNIKVDGAGAMAAYEAGKKVFYGRRGQLNFACATCHVQHAGDRLRSELLSPVLGHATHWPVFRGGDNLISLQNRYEGCYKQVRAVPPAQGSDEFNNLEYFHSYLSNGLTMKASVFRK